MKVRLEIRLPLRGGLFVGGGSAPVALGVDRATMRRQDGTVLVPGSGVKGRLRNGCEQVAPALGVTPCLSPKADLMCPHHGLRKGEPTRYCMVCEIFGSPWLPCLLRFSDLLWLAPHGISRQDWSSLPKTQIRPSVSLSRHRRVAFPQRLFFSDTVFGGSGAAFSGTIEGELPTVRHLALLVLGVHSLYAIGGAKSRGLGWIENNAVVRPYSVVEPSEFPLQAIMDQWSSSP